MATFLVYTENASMHLVKGSANYAAESFVPDMYLFGALRWILEEKMTRQ